MRARLLLAAVLVSGCGTAQIEPKYKFKGVPGIPMADAPAVFVEVPENDVAALHYKGGGFVRSARFTKPFGPFVQETLGQELQRMGLRAAPTKSEADATLKVAAPKLNVYYKYLRFNHLAFATDVTLTMQMLAKSGAPVWTGDFIGYGQVETMTPGAPGDVPQSSFNEALADALDKVRPGLELAQVASRLAGRAMSSVAGQPAAAPARVAGARSDIDDLPAAAPQNPKRHAVVVGIERYRERMPMADFAAGDARLFAEYAKRVLGVPESNLALLVDDRAAKSDLEKHFDRWLPNRVQAGDEVFVYFSGHGAPSPAKGTAFLVPYDGDPGYIEDTGYAMERLYANLSKLPAKSVLVAMDSCFSGAGGRSVIAEGARPLVSSVNTQVPANLTVLSASAGDQISNSYKEKSRGLFTYFLLKGMKEKGDDFRAVYDYLKPEVSKVARRDYNADQDPQWRGAR